MQSKPKIFKLPKLSIILVALTAITCSHFVHAQSGSNVIPVETTSAQDTLPSPLPKLEKIADDMIHELKIHKADMKRDPNEVYQIVDKILLPHADLELMSRLALGPNAWRAATPTQRKAFTEAFTHLMISTYAAGLSSYTDEKMKFQPIRGGIPSGKTRVEVQSEIIRSDGPPIPVNYRLIYTKTKTAKMDWLVYDFSVEGISMIQSFRSQFASELSNGMSVDKLTQKLNQHNAQPMAQ